MHPGEEAKPPFAVPPQLFCGVSPFPASCPDTGPPHVAGAGRLEVWPSDGLAVAVTMMMVGI
jgi:hypothetical protein